MHQPGRKTSLAKVMRGCSGLSGNTIQTVCFGRGLESAVMIGRRASLVDCVSCNRKCDAKSCTSVRRIQGDFYNNRALGIVVTVVSGSTRKVTN